MEQEFLNDNDECLSDLSPEEKLRREMEMLQAPTELAQYAGVDIYEIPIVADSQADALSADAIIPEEARNKIWEYNHAKISRAIPLFLLEFDRMPSYTELAAYTGISRETISKHLKSHALHPQYHEEIEQFRSMETKVLSAVANLALKGDMTAARLYCKVMHKHYRKPEQAEVEPNSWYYCGVNGRVLSRYHLSNLSPQQVDGIEAILKQPIPGRETEEDLLIQNLPPEARQEAKNQYWERNHQCIVQAVAEFIHKNKRMPNNTELAASTQLTPKTISKHFHNFRAHPFYEEELEQYRTVSSRLLTVVSDLAVKGNLKAAGLYFHLVNEVYTQPCDAAALLARQKECVMVNKIRVNHEVINQLSEEQRQGIAEILAGYLH